MKLEILQEDLSKALNSASHFVSSKMQLPVIANVLLKAEKNRLIISATNLEMAISVPVGVKIIEDGEITVPAKTFYEVVSNLPKGQISLLAEKEKLVVESSSFSSSLLGINASEFPKLPHDISTTDIVEISKEMFFRVLSKVLFSVSSDETRPILTGVLFSLRKGKLRIVSTDGFRLSLSDLISVKSDKEFSVVIPKTVLNELVRIPFEETILNFCFDEKENQVVFQCGKTFISSRIIDGNFPDYEKIMPKDSKISVEVDVSDFVRANKLASIFARDASNVVKLDFGKNVIGFSSESGRSGSQRSQIDAKVEGLDGAEKLIVAFNYKYLDDLLNVVSGEFLNLGLGGPDSPAIFKDPTDSEFFHIIMPVKLASTGD
jgi:DNA polymerase-3 subunit beta